MLNYSEKYRFSDFTLENYKRLLEIAKKEYAFIFFQDIADNLEKTIILRHDLEFSIPIALEMAEIEASAGIKSTYFLQIHGDFYNILEKNNLETVKKISKMGHQLGLHFDAHFWEISDEAKLEKYMLIDKQVLKQYLGIEPKVFSFHNTDPFILSCKKETYAGMINVYSKKINDLYSYCADSTGYWRYEILEDRLIEAEDERLQLLIHDGMWQDEVLPPRRRIYKVIDDHAAFMKESYDRILKKFSAKNIDWEGEV
jgi:hypothetical protein